MLERALSLPRPPPACGRRAGSSGHPCRGLRARPGVPRAAGGGRAPRGPEPWAGVQPGVPRPPRRAPPPPPSPASGPAPSRGRRGLCAGDPRAPARRPGSPRPGRAPGPRRGVGRRRRDWRSWRQTQPRRAVTAGDRRRRREAGHSPLRRLEAGHLPGGRGAASPLPALRLRTGPGGTSRRVRWPCPLLAPPRPAGDPLQAAEEKPPPPPPPDRLRVPGKVEAGRGARGRPGGEVLSS